MRWTLHCRGTLVAARRPGMTVGIQTRIIAPVLERPGEAGVPFSVSPNEGNGAPGGARGLRDPFGLPLRSGYPRAVFQRWVCEAHLRARAPLAIGVLRLPALHLGLPCALLAQT